MRRISFVLKLAMLLLIASVVRGSGGWPLEPQGYFVNPIFVPDGKAIIATNERYSSLYLLSVKDGSMREILRELGCGFRPSFSPDEREVGIKILRDSMQVPCMLSLETGQVKELHKPVPLAGEVPFSLNGKIALTIGNDLVVIDSKGRKKYIPLGVYANIAPISPDGKSIVYDNGRFSVR